MLSTGASHLHEICEALDWIDPQGKEVALMHFILNSPCGDVNANLGMMLDLKRRFPERMLGYSDHTLPGDMHAIEVATLLGARVIEKHFTHDKGLPGRGQVNRVQSNRMNYFTGTCWSDPDRRRGVADRVWINIAMDLESPNL